MAAKWLAKIFGANLGDTVSKVTDAAAKFAEGHLGKKELHLQLETIIHKEFMKRASLAETELDLKTQVMVAELQQEDLYTKRTRPKIARTGLWIIVFNYCVIPSIQLLVSFSSEYEINIEPFALPGYFWAAWGSIVAVYGVGKSLENFGINNQITQLMTGGKKKSKLPSINRMMDAADEA
jgi:hypothetical protein